MVYKSIVDGRWIINNAKTIEVDLDFINDVYTAPHKPVLPKLPAFHSRPRHIIPNRR